MLSGTRENITDAEATGMLVRIVQLENDRRKQERLLDKATEPTAIELIKTEINKIDEKLDTLTLGAKKHGSIAGRVLNLQKLAITRDYSLAAVKRRAKAKKGRELNQQESAKIEELVTRLQQADRDIKRLQEEVADLASKQFAKQGSVARYKRMNQADRSAERASLIDKIQQLADEGC